MDKLIELIKARTESNRVLVDDSGRRNLRNMIVESSNPWNVVSDYQNRASLPSTRIQPALRLIDELHFASMNANTTNSSDSSTSITATTTSNLGPRARTYQQMFDVYKNTLQERIKNASQEKLLILLEETFRFIGSPDIKAIPQIILGQLNQIPDKYLKTLTHEKFDSISKELPIQVRRQVWEKDHEYFLRMV